MGHTTHPSTIKVFGFLLLGGVHSGATVRDVRLANELARQGYAVRVWWAFDVPEPTRLDSRIHQSLLFHPLRYRLQGRPSGVLDALGRLFTRLTTYRWRAEFVQRHPGMLHRFFTGLLRRIAEGVNRDQRLLRRFACEMRDAGITYMLPGLEILSPFVEAAQRVTGLDVPYLVTLQGYEVCLNGVEDLDLRTRLMAVIRETVCRSDFPAVAVGRKYRERILRDFHLSEDQVVVMHPCVETPTLIPIEQAERLVVSAFPEYRTGIPLVSFVGRQDVEKGIDLLLYSAATCRRKGIEFQLLICGPTALAETYQQMCRQIANHLELPVLWGRLVSDELRTAIFQLSQTVVYPSIHGEPYGMAPVEAMLCGTRAIVAEHSGAADENSGVLTFSAGDTNALAARIQESLEHPESTQATQYVSPKKLADQIIQHLSFSRCCDSRATTDRE